MFHPRVIWDFPGTFPLWSSSLIPLWSESRSSVTSVPSNLFYGAECDLFGRMLRVRVEDNSSVFCGCGMKQVIGVNYILLVDGAVEFGRVLAHSLPAGSVRSDGAVLRARLYEQIHLLLFALLSVLPHVL